MEKQMFRVAVIFAIAPLLFLVFFLASTALAQLANPNNIDPASGATNISLTPTFRWSGVAGATSYYLNIFGTRNYGPLNTVTFAIPAAEELSSNTAYTWNVAATGPGGVSASTPTSFTTGAGGGGGGGAICPIGAICIENPLRATTFEALLNSIIDFIFWVGITIAPIIFIIAGFLFITSAGDVKKLETAKHMMLYAIIGLAVLLLARGLVAVLKSILGAQ